MNAFSRRHLFAAAVAGAAAATLPRAARAACRGPQLPLVEEQTFLVPGLDPAHDGLRIAQLSDIHVGVPTPVEVVRAAIDAANAARPDLVVLTGDYLCHFRTGVGLVREQLGGLRAPTVAVLGNHDHWVDADGAAGALRGHGYAVLRNENTSATLRGERFTIIGVDDLRTKHADVPKAFAGAARGSRVVLAHVPRTADLLAARGEPLVCLSGHTHGGQIHVPKLTAALTRVIDGERYVRGRFDVGGVQLHVNRGVGNSGIRVRVDAPPEVTLVTLRTARETA